MYTFIQTLRDLLLRNGSGLAELYFDELQVGFFRIAVACQLRTRHLAMLADVYCCTISSCALVILAFTGLVSAINKSI